MTVREAEAVYLLYQHHLWPWTQRCMELRGLRDWRRKKPGTKPWQHRKAYTRLVELVLDARLDTPFEQDLLAAIPAIHPSAFSRLWFHVWDLRLDLGIDHLDATGAETFQHQTISCHFNGRPMSPESAPIFHPMAPLDIATDEGDFALAYLRDALAVDAQGQRFHPVPSLALPRALAPKRFPPA